MINEISDKVSTLDYSRKTDNKNNDREKPAKSELDSRSELRGEDNVEISGQYAEKVIEPVSGQDKDVQLQSDVSHQEANADGHLSPNVEKSEKSTNDTNDRAELSDEQRKDVEELQKRDNEVRQHENAHVAAAGAYAQGVSFQYQAGPDGQRYAVGGEVSIDTSPVHDNPDATIAKAQVIRSAANAPVDPSAQDRQVAAATRMEAAARTEKTTESTKDDEVKIIIPGDTDTKSEVNETNDPAKGVPAKEESSLVDALTSAYGTKETEVGKVIRMTA